MKYLYLILAVILIIAATTVAFIVPTYLSEGNQESIYIGVSFCGNTTTEAKLLVDRVKSYTNLLCCNLQAWRISQNETAVYEICDYAVAQGLKIIVNLGAYYEDTWSWQIQILKNAKERWGNQFLGVYYSDEPAGLQLDYNWTDFAENMTEFFEKYPVNSSIPISETPALYQMYLKLMDAQVNGTKPQDYNLEAKLFLDYFKHDPGFIDLKSTDLKIFVSDYVLHWFDYLAGYDVVLAQFGANSSYIRDIDFIRGAANLQNKDWGAIITWKYSEPPYLDTEEEIHQQMLAACAAGAKYIIIFNYPQIEGNPYGVMQPEHFQALERFANDVMDTAKLRTFSDLSKAEAVLVLPTNYGWGMRRSDDIIWGYWQPDGNSVQIWDNFCKLILRYGISLDIVYDDPVFPVAGKYAHVYYWNQTV
jgi:hypothetical protein